MKSKNNTNINDNKIPELLKLSVGNNITNISYNNNKQESSNQNFGIIYYEKSIQKNIVKMIYKINKKSKDSKIMNQNFVLNNITRAKIIINNKQKELKENIENKKQIIKIKIKFLDKIFNLNCMFKDCKSLTSV